MVAEAEHGKVIVMEAERGKLMVTEPERLEVDGGGGQVAVS